MKLWRTGRPLRGLVSVGIMLACAALSANCGGATSEGGRTVTVTTGSDTNPALAASLSSAVQEELGALRGCIEDTEGVHPVSGVDANSIVFNNLRVTVEMWVFDTPAEAAEKAEEEAEENPTYVVRQFDTVVEESKSDKAPTGSIVPQCHGATEPEAPTEPEEPTEPSGPISIYDYPNGYPKRVPVSSVPDNMSLYSGADEGLTWAVALAPGVWVRREAGTTIQENADYGSLFGWCASVEKFQRTTGRDDGMTCW